MISPQPSPFLSDWEVDPAIGELIVTNTTAATTDVTFHYTLTRGGQVLLRGTTAAHTIPTGESVVFNATSTFGGRADWDRSVQGQVAQTGRLPEGEYEGCVTLVGPGNIVLAPRECARFSLQYPDPPFLVFPLNGDTITSQDPIFEWQPVQLPPAADGRIGYVLQIAEVRTEARQLPEVALQSSILHYLEPDLIQTSHQYPVGAMPLVPGRTYAWRVQALDGEGRPVAANQGRSDIWTFVYREAGTEVTTRVARVALESGRDTLRYAGDTTRVVARLYDADNIEIRGKRVAWSSLDTTVARVDTAGIVRGAGAGETRIVATVDGVADSALSVTADPGTFTVRFEPFDAATDRPSLLDLIASGSFEETVPKVMAMLESGEFRIPVPRLPGVERAESAQRGLESEDGVASGPYFSHDGHAPRTARATCTDGAFNARERYVDHASKSIMFYLPVSAAQRTDVKKCFGVYNDIDGDAANVDENRGLAFVISWSHPGVPRAYVAYKGPGLGIALGGTQVEAQFLVLNLTLEAKLGSKFLPEVAKGFFGDIEFDAGHGVTYYSRRKCDTDTTELCQLLRTINEAQPYLTIKGFAGVKEEELSVENERGDEGARETKLTASKELGFEISALTPVGYPGWEIGSTKVDSLQLELELSGKLEVEVEKGAAENEVTGGPGFALKASVWLTGGAGRHWHVNLSGGLESTFGDDDASPLPVVVLSGELEQTWALTVFRIGTPKLEFKTPLGPREKREATELELSGEFGFGSPAGLGFAPEDEQFAELGSGAVTLKWERPATEATRAKARKTLETVKADQKVKDDAVWAAMERVKRAKVERGLAQESGAGANTPAAPPSPGLLAPPSAAESAEQRRTAADAELAAAEKALAQAEAAAEAVRKKWEKASYDAGPPICWKTVGTRCLNWSTKLSLNTAGIADLVAMLFRFATGLQ